MKDKTISMEEAVKIIRFECGEFHGISGRIIEKLEALPPAQPGWIPVTERLPDNKRYVLTVIYIPGRQAHVRSGFYEGGFFMNDNGDTWQVTEPEVVAWMYQPKLPKPWEGEKP